MGFGYVLAMNFTYFQYCQQFKEFQFYFGTQQIPFFPLPKLAKAAH